MNSCIYTNTSRITTYGLQKKYSPNEEWVIWTKEKGISRQKNTATTKDR
jgi:hypothetical protein